MEGSRRTDIKVRKLSEIGIGHSLILLYDVGYCLEVAMHHDLTSIHYLALLSSYVQNTLMTPAAESPSASVFMGGTACTNGSILEPNISRGSDKAWLLQVEFNGAPIHLPRNRLANLPSD